MGAILNHIGALSHPFFGSNQNSSFPAYHKHSDNIIFFRTQGDAFYAHGFPPTCSDIIFRESDRLAFIGSQKNIVFTISDSRFNEFVALSNFNGINTTFSRITISRQNSLFHNSFPRSHGNIVVIIKLLHAHKCFHFFTWRTTNQIHNGSAACSPSTLGNIINFQPITLSLVRKKEHIVVSVGNKKMFNKVFIFAHCALNPSASSSLCPIGV